MAEHAWHIEAQGRVVKISRRREPRPDAPPPPGRGKLTGFSRKSRKRLIDIFNRIDFQSKRVAFVTLTLHDLHTFKNAKLMLDRFLARLRRKHPTVSAIWKKELQERGAIHYHLITFGMPYYPQDALQGVWTACTGEDLSIVDIRRVDNHRQLMQYVSKYVSKVQSIDSTTSLENQPYLYADQNPSTGRWWGVLNRDELPWAAFEESTIWNAEMIKYLRWSMESISNGFASGNQHGATLYIDDAYAMFDHALHLNLFMPDRSFLQEAIWQGCKHGARTVQALSEIRQARITVGESVKSVTEALCLLAHIMPAATPQERVAAARRMVRLTNHSET